MNRNRNYWNSGKRVKTPYFHCDPSSKNRKHKREIEKNRKIYSMYKRIYVKAICKLKWLSP